MPPTTAPQWQARCRDCVGVPTSRGKCLERATSGIFQAPLRPLARRQRSGGAFRKHRLTYVLFVGWPRF